MERAHPGLKRLRAIVSGFPETSERLSHGAPTFWGGRKTFATFHDGHYDGDRPGIWIKATFEAQRALCESDPETYYVPKYVGPSGWVGVRVRKETDWDRVAEILEMGYRLVAPKRAVAELDRGRG